jgi:hypothetical protein
MSHKNIFTTTFSSGHSIEILRVWVWVSNNETETHRQPYPHPPTSTCRSTPIHTHTHTLNVHLAISPIDTSEEMYIGMWDSTRVKCSHNEIEQNVLRRGDNGISFFLEIIGFFLIFDIIFYVIYYKKRPMRFYGINWDISHNGTVCTVEQIGRACGVKMITLIDKLTNLKYDLLLAYLERDIRISRHL